MPYLWFNFFGWKWCPLNIIIIIIIISSIKTNEPVFYLFCASCFNRYECKRKNPYALITSLNILLLGLVTCRLNLDDVYLDGIFMQFSDNSFLPLVQLHCQWYWGFPDITSSFYALHQHCMLSLGGLVLPSPVGLLMVYPLPLPVGLVPVMGVDGGGVVGWSEEEGRGLGQVRYAEVEGGGVVVKLSWCRGGSEAWN